MASTGSFDKLSSSIGGGSGRSCPDRGEALRADSEELSGRYECRNEPDVGQLSHSLEVGALP